ncbi:MAG: hypothetical protein ABR505_12160 [Actinomycetota bacterium]
MLLDAFMPGHDFFERHEILVRASPADAYRAIRNVDFGRSFPIAVLLAVRGLPHFLTRKLPSSRHVTLDYILQAGFVVLAEAEQSELVLGAVGKFWRLDSGFVAIRPEDFTAFNTPGYAKAVLNFTAEENSPKGCLVTTETRIVCTDAASKRKFALYWKLIGPFSGLIRGWALGLIRADAEALASARESASG